MRGIVERTAPPQADKVALLGSLGADQVRSGVQAPFARRDVRCFALLVRRGRIRAMVKEDRGDCLGLILIAGQGEQGRDSVRMTCIGQGRVLGQNRFQPVCPGDAGEREDVVTEWRDKLNYGLLPKVGGRTQWRVAIQRQPGRASA